MPESGRAAESRPSGGGSPRRVVVTGGAGFLGSHLCERLVSRGDEVICIDNLSTGHEGNLAGWGRGPRFRFLHHDVASGLDLAEVVASLDAGRRSPPIDLVFHLASPASPVDYLRLPLETLAAGSLGTTRALQLAGRHGARLVLASTSEVYGDPLNHPQVEADWGHVNPVGPRSVYDEAKRYAEAVTMAYHRHHGLSVGIARIFNTYGPRLRPGDGRVVSNFIAHALAGEPLTVYGAGTQTRSFCYVDDLVTGLVSLGDADVTGPVNLGNPEEHTVRQLADLVVALTGSASDIVHGPLPVDDPVRRRPDVTRAADLLGWRPVVPLMEGLVRTIGPTRVAPGRLGPGAGRPPTRQPAPAGPG